MKNYKRIVIKIGSGVLDCAQNQFDLPVLKNIVDQLAELKKSGVDICIVTSGAVSSGMRELKLTKKPGEITEKQALAAIGQGKLIHTYATLFASHNITIAQVLLSREDLEKRRRFLNARNTLQKLFESKVIPIINENDSVATEELRYGDNDLMSSLVSIKIDAELLILLTTVDGLFDKNPLKNPEARIISAIENFDEKYYQMSDKRTSLFGSGGMASKLEAAHMAVKAGIQVHIANGKRRGIIRDILDSKPVGTRICSQKCDLSSREKWIIYNSSSRGKNVTVDDGAYEALMLKGKSLLPSGIISVEGQFREGDIIKVVNQKGKIFAKGFTSYSSTEIEKIMGQKSSNIENILGYCTSSEVIHRNNMVLLKE